METAGGEWSQQAIVDTVRRFWGFDQLRPLQEQAIRAGLQSRDSLVVMPTGGGKSLCYQVPAALAERTDVVVSPLISLMKDQVDGLVASGYPAAALHSGMTPQEVSATERAAAEGRYRLLFVAPERLLSPRMLSLLERLRVRALAVDEAHCISHWGHDFRPEYRQLAALKERFAGLSMHAFTATATARVRTDIVEQLRLRDPIVLVGVFDRPNLTYRVVPRVDARSQVREVIKRHSGEAVIVYCLSRNDADSMAAALQARGIQAAAYHAGMEPAARRQTQDAFAEEKLDVVTATVAFGMGIDRSDVRCVVHAAMPKSIEHYQQETGRAGRDGLPAECILLYSAADVLRWESLINKSAAEAPAPDEIIASATELMEHMRRYCSVPQCRHRALSEYFGQAYEKSNCEGCDFCLGDVEGVADGTVTAQKILSCVARTGERFGAMHIVDVLLGVESDRIQHLRHGQLSTFGLLKGMPRKTLVNLVYQLIDAGVLGREGDERPVLRLNAESWKVMRGQRTVQLVQAKAGEVAETRRDRASWDGVDRDLFERLRALRRQIAADRQVPPYVVFSDATLREIAREKPTSAVALRQVKGVGDRKLAEFGPQVLAEVAAHGRGP